MTDPGLQRWREQSKADSLARVVAAVIDTPGLCQTQLARRLGMDGVGTVKEALAVACNRGEVYMKRCRGIALGAEWWRDPGRMACRYYPSGHPGQK